MTTREPGRDGARSRRGASARALVVVVLAALPIGVAAGRDRYGSFAELAGATREGEDWRVVERSGRTGSLVLAPHGGAIEPGTSELATAVAGDDHALYVFEAIRPRGNAELHVTSTRFDEPRCLRALAAADRVLALHGCDGEAPRALVGGRDAALLARVMTALREAGVDAVPAEGDLAGAARENVCNRGRSSAGVQVELTRALRATLFEGLDARGRARPTPALAALAAALRAALAAR